MTREEQIFEASKKFSEYEYNKTNFENGFINGAKWADKNPINVWHDTNEEPNINEDVVLYDSCGNFVTEFYNGDVTWNNIVFFHKATMWTYKDDLLNK